MALKIMIIRKTNYVNFLTDFIMNELNEKSDEYRVICAMNIIKIQWILIGGRLF